ncbi:sigma-70 family RNA polymerase sigma factor [uncultured Alistipes sp.]|uniref:RNA polymerase sigma factor n=1 Tax=uncultured Alistipes sp. TaxID=538949 RepID=UPI00338F613B
MGAYKREIERCFRKYYGALCFFASRYVEDPDKAEDLVQDCFVRLLEREFSFDSEDHLKNYLYAAVRNGCLNFLRDNRAVAFPPPDILLSCADTDDAAEEIVSAEVIRRLIARIDDLPPQCRQVMRLSYVNGWDNESVADRLGLSVNTVRAQKMRGKMLLKLHFCKNLLCL